MKIYFAGSIRGGRGDQELYFSIITELKKYGTVLTEHLGNRGLTTMGEMNRPNEEIFTRDMEWVKDSDLVVAEVTTPSIGVGYELRQAEFLGKPALCLYRETEGKRLSAMLSGNKYFNIQIYKSLEDLSLALKKYFKSINI